MNKKYLIILIALFCAFILPHLSHAATIIDPTGVSTSTYFSMGGNYGFSVSNPTVAPIVAGQTYYYAYQVMDAHSAYLNNDLCYGSNANPNIGGLGCQTIPDPGTDALTIATGTITFPYGLATGGYVYMLNGNGIAYTGHSSLIYGDYGGDIDGSGNPISGSPTINSCGSGCWYSQSMWFYLGTTPYTPGGGGSTPSLSFLWPTDGTTTPQFDNFVVQASNVTSTEEYYLGGSWILHLTQQTTQWQGGVYTGAQLEAGVAIPMTNFPNVPNSDIGELPANAYACINDALVGCGENPIASTSVPFNISSQNNTTTPIFYNVTASSTAPGGFVIATTTQAINPFYSTGGVVCPAPTGTIFSGDLGPTIDYMLCQLQNAFIYPHSFSTAMVTSSLARVESNPPFAYVYDALGDFASSSAALESASTTDLSFQFKGNPGVVGIVPTTSIAVIDNTAFADLTGSSTFDATIHSDLFTAEDNIFWLLLVAGVVGIIIKVRKGFH